MGRCESGKERREVSDNYIISRDKRRTPTFDDRSQLLSCNDSKQTEKKKIKRRPRGRGEEETRGGRSMNGAMGGDSSSSLSGTAG